MSDCSDRRGFTLLEVLLTFVLIATAWVIFAVNMEGVLDKNPLAELEGAFVLAQTEARMLAFEDRRPLELRWDGKAKRFVLVDRAVIASYPVKGVEDAAINLKATFYFQEPLYKGESFNNPSWFEVEGIVIYPDATSAPFKVLLEAGTRTRELVVEPFTGFATRRS